MITLTINGKQGSVAPGTTVKDYVEALGVDARMIAVGHNGEALRRDDWGGATLVNGDRLEIVRAVGGG